MARSCVYHTRFVIGSLITLGLTAVLLWGLASIYDPTATLTKITITPGNENYSTIYLELELQNRNYFRGFNYTDEGWIEIFRLTNNSRSWMEYDYIPKEYQGFGDTLRWNFTINLTKGDLDWRSGENDIPMLKSHETQIYVTLCLTYLSKILFWVTETTYYQWLDTSVSLDKNLAFHGISNFNRIQDFTNVVN